MLSRESSIDSRREELALNLEGAIASFELIDHVDQVCFGECYVLQRDARYRLIGSASNVPVSLLSRDVIKFNSDSICFAIL